MHDQSPTSDAVAQPTSDLVLSLLDEPRLRRVLDEVITSALGVLEARLVEQLKANTLARAGRADDDLLTEREVATMLRISSRSVRRLERAREIPSSVRIGGCKRFVAQDIRDWLGRERERARWSA